MRFLGMMLAFFLAASAQAQLLGDYDNDGDVDAADFAHWGDCMGGPAGGVGSGCAPFDFTSSGYVGLASFLGMQQAPTGPAGSCEHPYRDACMCTETFRNLI